MAIIRSIAIGKARKSMGNVTMRTVRGRTIGSEKVGARPGSRAPSGAQVQREVAFGLMSRFARLHAGSIGVSFTRTKYGSPRNAFMKLNYEVLFQPMIDLYEGSEGLSAITDQQIEAAVTAYATANPNEIVRIALQGQNRVYLSGSWTSVPDPAPVDPGNNFVLDTIGMNGIGAPFSEIAPGIGITDNTGDAQFVLTGNRLTQISAFAALLDANGSSVEPGFINTVTNKRLTANAQVSDPEDPTPTQVYGVRLTVAGQVMNYFFA